MAVLFLNFSHKNLIGCLSNRVLIDLRPKYFCESYFNFGMTGSQFSVTRNFSFTKLRRLHKYLGLEEYIGTFGIWPSLTFDRCIELTQIWRGQIRLTFIWLLPLDLKMFRRAWYLRELLTALSDNHKDS